MTVAKWGTLSKLLLAVVMFSSETLDLPFFQLCFRELAFSDKFSRMYEFKMLK